jgi:hypothetical protein
MFGVKVGTELGYFWCDSFSCTVGEIGMRNLTLVLMTLALGSAANVWAAGGPTNVAGSSSAAARQVTSDGQPLEEVTVIGKIDRPTLKHEIHQFVQSHADASGLIGQIGRWREPVCPLVLGLQDPYNSLIAHRITDVAREVGVRISPPNKHCDVNVEVVFTAEPQKLVDHIAAAWRPLLGYYVKADLKDLTTFNHPIQAWYMTGTRALTYPPMQVAQYGSDIAQMLFAQSIHVDKGFDAQNGDWGPAGNAESRLNHNLRSEFMHALIVVDNKSIAKSSLRSVADYVALLALTRLSTLDQCSELPSIVNLFAPNCAAPPSTITSADIAYLKALYGADLELKLALEQGDIRERMLKTISSK